DGQDVGVRGSRQAGPGQRRHPDQGPRRHGAARRCDPRGRPAGAAGRGGGGAMRGTILVVEDNPDNMKLLAWTLEDEGFAFEGAASAEEALLALERRPFDLILMDISLPGMDGAEATRRLRAQSRFAGLPIIAVTAHAVQGEAQ